MLTVISLDCISFFNWIQSVHFMLRVYKHFVVFSAVAKDDQSISQLKSDAQPHGRGSFPDIAGALNFFYPQ